MPYRALYRKYRPRRFADIIGQPGIVKALTNQVETGRISHAYLFSGPRGTGKTTAAKVLARAVNCTDNRGGEPCGECRACVELTGEIDAASNNSVDRVREMIENVKYMPAVGRYRVYIVDEVHMLSPSAFNALLKTLEEPPAHVVFILATTEPHKLPPTVLSRCQQFQFRRIPSDAMAGLLRGVLKTENASAEPEALQAIARASGGGMRDALSLLDQCLSLDESLVTKKRVLDMLGTLDSSYYFSLAECLLSGDAGGATGLLDGFINAGGDLRTFANDLCLHMRDLFIASYVKEPSGLLDLFNDDASRLAVQAARHAPGDILKCLGILSELEGGLRYAANPRVLMELALFRCCRAEKENSYGDLAARMERMEARLEKEAPPSILPAAPPPQEPVLLPDASPEAEDIPQDAGGAALSEEGGQEEAVPAPTPQEETLQGQLDLFSGENAAGTPQPGTVWRAALEELKKQPQLLAFASKGRAAEFDGRTLTVSFTEDERSAANMLDDAGRMAKLNEAVDKAAGRHVEIRLKVTQWSPAQQQFIDKSREVIPKGTVIEIEKEE
jgi:DNA polymerase-3 subunit gamma/tau